MTKQIVYFGVSFLLTVQVLAQVTSLDNYTGDWQDNASWVGGIAPGTTISNAVMNGYITLNGSLTVAGTLTVNDTLVVTGNATFSNQAGFDIDSGGVFIVLGNLRVNNKISIENGGVVAVGNEFSRTSNSGQGLYSGSGAIYAGSFDQKGEDWIDSKSGGDNSKTIDQLSDDGFTAIENFISNNVPLPVTLISFEAQYQEGIATLEWQTATEENFSHFEVERSRDGQTWEYVGYLEGNGFKYTISTYQFEDNLPLSGYSYYRLKAVDFDGYTEYFGPVGVKVTLPTDVQVTPTTNGFVVRSSDKINEVLVVDRNGKGYQATKSDGGYSVTARPGIYIIKTIDSKGNRQTKKVVVR